ncbi:MAG: TAXI family TRAP transporter solute-binding subunit [Actinobacteria bacterium]|nr:TAXI family TRAP transporter solute-binding subunit [Actinomycetota bacterium]
MSAPSAGLTRRAVLTGLAGTGLLAMAGCDVATPATLDVGCGEDGGSYLEFGRLLAEAAQRSGRLRLRPLVTEGSVENLTLLDADRVALALSLADSAAGSPTSDLVAVGRVYQNYLQCVVRADGGIRTLGDLSGRVVSLGAPGSGAAATARRVLAAAGLLAVPDGPVVVERLLGEAATQLRTGAIDALFWSGGVPTPQIAALSGTTALRLVDTTTVLPRLREQYPDAYIATAIPAGVYGGEEPVPTIGIANLLLARSSLTDGAVAALVDILIDDARALVPPDAAGVQYLTPASLIDTVPVPLHPAAARRYRERYG